LAKSGYTIPPSDTYKTVGIWADWYNGRYKKFHDYTLYNGRSKQKRRRRSLKMAKKVTEDWANLLLNEKVQVTVSDARAHEYITAALEKNHFRVQGNKLVERAFALGSGAFVEHTDGKGGVMIDYVRGDCIYPISWDGDTVTECAFASIKNSGKSKTIYLNIHVIEDDGYVIYNMLIPVEGDASGTPADDNGLLPGNLASVFRTSSLTPRFQIIGPNVANNIDLDSPLGISIYANSLDLLEGCDLVYDSYYNEFRLGKKRIMINGALTKIAVDATSGEQVPIFDDNDTEYYALPEFQNDSEPIHEINMELRVEDHDKAIIRFISLLSDKCGLGADRYRYENGVLKTATEVISDKSELYQNLKKHELVLSDALIGMCRAIAEIGGFSSDFDVDVAFDDSIIEDTTGQRNRIQVLVTQGKFPLWRYLRDFEGYDEKTAREIEAETKAANDVITFEDLETGG
jgi:A118 family predicted phage portal protein